MKKKQQNWLLFKSKKNYFCSKINKNWQKLICYNKITNIDFCETEVTKTGLYEKTKTNKKSGKIRKNQIRQKFTEIIIGQKITKIEKIML